MKSIQSITDYISKINEIYDGLETMLLGKAPNALFFRGHSKTSYELIPSALRNGGKEERVYLLNYRDNIPRHSPSYDFIKHRTEILADMQHFGMKTRLIDWTFSPLTALYFALVHKSGEENSEVCVFNPWKYRSEFFTKSIERNSSAHDMHILGRALLSTHSIAEIKNILKAEFHGNSLEEEDLRLPFPFVAKYGNSRLIHQSGCFTIHGNAPHISLDRFSEVSDDSQMIWKIQIQKENRDEIMKELNRLFINHYSVYPDLEGMSEHFDEYDSLYSVRRNKSQK